MFLGETTLYLCESFLNRAIRVFCMGTMVRYLFVGCVDSAVVFRAEIVVLGDFG